MRITRTIVIDAPLEKVWKVTAHDFAEVGTWASGVSLSGIANGAPPNDEAEMAGRFCITASGKCYEMFEAYDEQQHTFTYAAQFEKTPPGLVSAHNTWHAEAISGSQSRFTMSVDIELNLFPGLLMRLPMRFQIPRVLDMNLEEMKVYVETGRPHPRKLAALRKAGQPVSSLLTN